MKCPNPQIKLNAVNVKFCTIECLPHIPITDFSRLYFLGRKSIFTLAKDGFLSMTQVRRRYFVAIAPPYTINDIYDYLDYRC